MTSPIDWRPRETPLGPPAAPVAAAVRPPRAKVGRTGWVLILGLPALIFALVGVAFAAGAMKPIPPDARIVGCTSDGGSGLYTLEATVGIVNNHSTAMDYLVTVAFTSDGGSVQLDTATASVRDLQPGQSAAPTATALSQAPAPADMQCRLIRVTRL